MIFYIKTHYSEGVRKWFFRNNYVIDLISIGVMTETGQDFFAANEEFHSRYITTKLADEVIANLPSRDARIWKAPSQIVADLHTFMMFHGNGNDVELVFENPLDFAAFCSLLGGTNSRQWPIWLPKYYTDVKQQIREYLDDMDNSEFEQDFDFTRRLVAHNNELYRREQKQEMLEAHRLYPELGKAYTSVLAALNMRKLHHFFKIFKISHRNNLQEYYEANKESE